MAQFSNATRAIPFTLSDTVNFPAGICEALYFNTYGTVQVVMEDNSVVPFVVSAASPLLPVKAKRINATSTTGGVSGNALY